MPRRSACSSSRAERETPSLRERPSARLCAAELERALVHVVEVLDEGDRAGPRARVAERLREEVPADRHEAGRVHVVREVDLGLHPERVVGATPLVVEHAAVGDPQVEEGGRRRSLAARAPPRSPPGGPRPRRARPAAAGASRAAPPGWATGTGRGRGRGRSRARCRRGRCWPPGARGSRPVSRLSRMTDPRRWIISPMATPPREVETMSFFDIGSVSPQHSHSTLPATASEDEPQNPSPLERPAL